MTHEADMLHHRPGVIVPSAARGIRRVRGGLRHDPWNLNRFTPAEGARRRGSRPAPAFRRSQRAMSKTTIPTPAPTASDAAAGDYGDNFPGSTKAYVGGADGVRVPVRRIALSARRTPARRLRHERPARARRPRRAAGAAARVDPRPRGRRGRAAPPARAGHRHERGAEGAHPPGAARHRAGDPAALRAQGRDHAGDGRSSPRARASPPSSSATRWRAAAPSSRPTSTTPSSSR